MQFVNNLINPWNQDVRIHKQLELFAKSLGWFPSDIVEEKSGIPCTGHLIVDHGLDNAAVISFIDSKFDYEDLVPKDKNEILKVSYNNLVDLHITVDRKTVTAIHNRLEVAKQELYKGDLTEDNLRSDFFEELLRKKKIYPNIKSLDDAFIETISYWKRVLHADLNYEVTNEQLSSLFNALIFIRAVEDMNYRKDSLSVHSQKLISNLLNQKDIPISLVMLRTLKELGISRWPEHLISLNDIKAFDQKLIYSQIYKLFGDFYTNKFAPYNYDFSIISKHALSRIYERYVSLLKVTDSPQTSLFPTIAEEEINKLSGSYYTPQFIARFFTRYIGQLINNSRNTNPKIVEPAVGSGIFLRTYLEYQVNENFHDPSLFNNFFKNAEGIDKNITACNAARLSLSLLFLTSSGSMPKSDLINIKNADSLELLSKTKYKESFDFFISNPPFVAYKNQTEEDRTRLIEYLGEYSQGKPDLYFAFILMSIRLLKPGGTAFLVVPNTFLVSESAKPLRELVHKDCYIKCIVDLTAHEIFPEAGVYTILLVIEKTNTVLRDRDQVYNSKPLAIIGVIQDSIGEALSDILSRRNIESSSYSIYEVNQDYFDSSEWYLFPPSQYSLIKKLDTFRKVSDFLEVRTGFSSGSTEAFILKKQEIPKGESGIYIPYLSDREMQLYSAPKLVESYLFYPYIKNLKISTSELKDKFPKSFERLLKFKSDLKKRKEVTENRIEWWEPNRPREPEFMLVPKIITPHLVFSPRFSIDLNGLFAISRAPFFVLKTGVTDDMLYYILAILNSRVCFWYMLNKTPKYQHGYAMLERKSLVDLPVPDPYIIENRILVLKLISLVKNRLSSKNTDDSLLLEDKIEQSVNQLYNLSLQEKIFLNL
jgi:type I restriction-modification system DNA methylase subunit